MYIYVYFYIKDTGSWKLSLRSWISPRSVLDVMRKVDPVVSYSHVCVFRDTDDAVYIQPRLRHLRIERQTKHCCSAYCERRPIGSYILLIYLSILILPIVHTLLVYTTTELLYPYLHSTLTPVFAPAAELCFFFTVTCDGTKRGAAVC